MDGAAGAAPNPPNNDVDVAGAYGVLPNPPGAAGEGVDPKSPPAVGAGAVWCYKQKELELETTLINNQIDFGFCGQGKF